MPNFIGIAGTPIIDPATDIMYFFSKGYKGGESPNPRLDRSLMNIGAVGPLGTLGGQYKFYAVYIPSLQIVPGFPVIVDGYPATNDPTRCVLSRCYAGNVILISLDTLWVV